MHNSPAFAVRDTKIRIVGGFFLGGACRLTINARNVTNRRHRAFPSTPLPQVRDAGFPVGPLRGEVEGGALKVNTYGVRNYHYFNKPISVANSSNIAF